MYSYLCHTFDPAAHQIFEVHSRSGTRVSDDNHLPVPVVDMVPGTGEPAITQDFLKCVSSVAWLVWVCNTSQTGPIYI